MKTSSNTGILSKKLKVTIILLLLPVIAIICLAEFRFLFPWSIRSRLDMIFSQGRIIDKRIGFADPSQEVNLTSQDGLKIVGDLFLPNRPGKDFPGILMLHGSSRWGRKVAMSQLLARKLAEAGYVVLLIDCRGFGDSDDPPHPAQLDAWDARHDISAGLSFLESNELVNRNDISLVGHSMGGSYAIRAGIEDKRIKKIVAIGPGRNFLETFPDKKQFLLARFSRNRMLSSLIPMSTYFDHQLSFTVENSLPYFEKNSDKSLLLIDGALESELLKKFLQKYYNQMLPANRYVSIPDSGHYFNVVGFEWFKNIPFIHRIFIYDKKVIEDAAVTINIFLRQ